MGASVTAVAACCIWKGAVCSVLYGLPSSGDAAVSALATTHAGGVRPLTVAPVLVLAHAMHEERVLPVLAATDIALRTISVGWIVRRDQERNANQDRVLLVSC